MCTDGLGKSVEEVGIRCKELVATDEPAVVTETLFDAIVMEDGESDGCFSDPPWTDENDSRFLPQSYG